MADKDESDLVMVSNESGTDFNPRKWQGTLLSFFTNPIVKKSKADIKVKKPYDRNDTRKINQRLSRACIVHLVIKKNNWSYVKTMSCVILELRST
jgi:hypothetical protein